MGKSFIMHMFIKEQIMNGVKMNFARIVPTKALINEMRNDTINDLKNILEEQNYRVVTAASDISLEEEHNFILIMTPERLLCDEKRDTMARGKNIQLYLMDGDVNGRIKCTLANWTGLAFKIPRTALDLCKDRPELKQTGVYLLFGKDENDKSVVYIGQAGVRKNGEGILNRLVEHNRKSKSGH